MSEHNETLHPTIHTPGGGQIIIGPGTGAVVGATEQNAITNMRQFIADSQLEGLTWKRTADEDYGDGRYSFAVTWQGKTLDVQMPGWELEQVRYMKEPDQNIWDFPRLYVDHSSWGWKFAVLDRETFFSYLCNTCGALLTWQEVELEETDEFRCPLCYSDDLE